MNSLIAALKLPPEATIDKRVPKTLLLKHCKPTAADKRNINDGIEKLTWHSALRPSNIGVQAFQQDGINYLEIQVLHLTLRPEAKLPRLFELIHRAIPYPVILITEQPKGSTLSLTHKRKSGSGTVKVTLEPLLITEPLNIDNLSQAGQAFVESLAISKQPQTSLYCVYQGWIDRITALAVASVSGDYTIAATPKDTASRQEALARIEALEQQIKATRAKAKKARQMAQKVELNTEVKALETELAEVKTELKDN